MFSSTHAHASFLCFVVFVVFSTPAARVWNIVRQYRFFLRRMNRAGGGDDFCDGLFWADLLLRDGVFSFRSSGFARGGTISSGVFFTFMFTFVLLGSRTIVVFVSGFTLMFCVWSP